MLRPLAVAVGIALASLLVVDPAPSYDAWTWLLWGRELTELDLSTAEGPAFKPLPVLVCAVLSPLGEAAPWLWVVLVRVAALLALWLAYIVSRDLSQGARSAGVLAAVGVALCTGFAGFAADGSEPALVIGLGLGAALAWRDDRLRLALLCGAACALLRVEAWPFLFLAGAIAWRRRPGDRVLLVALAFAIPAAWFVPEWLGSGDPLRSGSRALIPNPGQPALADVPSVSALAEAVKLPLWPLWVGLVPLLVLLRSDRAALLPAAVGVAWCLIVAVMAQAGFSGEPRYSLPGAALIGVSGAVGLVLATRRAGSRVALAGVALVVAISGIPRIGELPEVRTGQAYAWDLATDLEAAVRAAGGRTAVLRCGQPYVGPLRGPLLAYRLRVAKRAIEPDDPPRRPGMVFRSALHAGATPAPDAPAGFRTIVRIGRWEVLGDCAAAAAIGP